ncbi:triose-phosphate isomerase [Baffinella frigidus]|nr:triose-phosphate isomerase [Cryptophyta sp. CCMP2293]
MKKAILAAALALPIADAFAPSPLSGAMPGLRAASTRGASTVSWNMMARRPFIAGNWKMNPETLDDAIILAKEIAKSSMTATAQVAICAPFPYLWSVGNEFKGSNVELGAQSIYFEDKGAYTGAVSACMVKSVGTTHVLCGHSERRTIFHNDDNSVNKKVLKVLRNGLTPMLCIGESQNEYEEGLVKAICATQMSKDLKEVTKAEMMEITIAYEPVWAIGTGLTCAPDEAQKGCPTVGSMERKEETADAVRILYGGSVTGETVDELMKRADIDGCLVGGASLQAASFGRIMNFNP